MRQYKHRTKLDRLFQRFNNWVNEFTDAKVMVAAFLFLCACLFWADKWMAR